MNSRGGGGATGVVNSVLWDLLEQGLSLPVGLTWCGAGALSELRRELCDTGSLFRKRQPVHATSGNKYIP